MATLHHHQTSESVHIPLPEAHAELEGDLTLPEDAHGVVLFAHGSGSSRFSSRNRFVAEQLRQGPRGIGTLLIDLLTAHEEAIDNVTTRLRFDVEMLAERVLAAAHWLRGHAATRVLPIGYFGASTGGGAALIAAARQPHLCGAVVSRGGRADLAGDTLPLVRAPTLLIVGGDDDIVIRLNRAALARMRCEKRLEIVPGATHLFEEPGTLEQVAALARQWFEEKLALVS